MLCFCICLFYFCILVMNADDFTQILFYLTFFFKSIVDVFRLSLAFAFEEDD